MLRTVEKPFVFYPQGSSNEPFYQALLRLIKADVQLRQECIVYHVCNKTLCIVAEAENLVLRRLLRIVRLILETGAKVSEVRINLECFSVQQLLELYPELQCKVWGSNDRRRKMEQISQDALRYRALLGFATSSATIFIIGCDGVYKDVHLQSGDAPAIPVEEMLGKPLDEVLPSLEVALRITQEIREAYRELLPRTIEYRLWDRDYTAHIYPIPGGNEVVLASLRQ